MNEEYEESFLYLEEAKETINEGAARKLFKKY